MDKKKISNQLNLILSHVDFIKNKNIVFSETNLIEKINDLNEYEKFRLLTLFLLQNSFSDQDDESLSYLVEFILEQNANPNYIINEITSEPECIAIHIAIYYSSELYSQGFIEKLNTKDFYLLIKYGADINIENKDGYTPLDMSRLKLHYLAEEILIDLGAKANKTSCINSKHRKICICARKGDIEYIKNVEYIEDFLMDKDSLVLEKGSPLYFAISGEIDKKYELIKYLLEKGSNPNFFINFNIIERLFFILNNFYKNDSDIIKKFLLLFYKNDANFNSIINNKYIKKKETLLDIAMKLNNSIIINFLLKLGAKTYEQIIIEKSNIINKLE
ncbi:MAG: hypothetical protein U0457_19235 [Candidatus Sericytochromatia bacterium]